MRKKLTTSEFIKKAREVHGNKYDYYKVDYMGTHTKVCIICPEHGEFWQMPSAHLNGQGCPKCAGKIKLIQVNLLIEHVRFTETNTTIPRLNT